MPEEEEEEEEREAEDTAGEMLLVISREFVCMAKPT